MLWVGNKRVKRLWFGDKAVATLWLGAKKIWKLMTSICCFDAGYWNKQKAWHNSRTWRNNTN